MLMTMKRGQKMSDSSAAGRSAALQNYDELRSSIKNNGGSWFNVAHNTTSGKGQNPDGRKVHGLAHIRDGCGHTRHLTNPLEHEGIKQRGSGRAWFDGEISRTTNSQSKARKAASAAIAKIPFPLARHIAAYWKPQEQAA